MDSRSNSIVRGEDARKQWLPYGDSLQQQRAVPGSVDNPIVLDSPTNSDQTSQASEEGLVQRWEDTVGEQDENHHIQEATPVWHPASASAATSEAATPVWFPGTVPLSASEPASPGWVAESLSPANMDPATQLAASPAERFESTMASVVPEHIAAPLGTAQSPSDTETPGSEPGQGVSPYQGPYSGPSEAKATIAERAPGTRPDHLAETAKRMAYLPLRDFGSQRPLPSSFTGFAWRRISSDYYTRLSPPIVTQTRPFNAIREIPKVNLHAIKDVKRNVQLVKERRQRRQAAQIERVYGCDHPGCDKAYGAVNHLNNYLLQMGHGTKKSGQDFKDINRRLRQERGISERAWNDMQCAKAGYAEARKICHEQTKGKAGKK